MARPTVSRLRQFLAVLHKNVILQTRIRSPKLFAVFRVGLTAIATLFLRLLSYTGCSRGKGLSLPGFGFAGALLNICTPALFFMVMWLPKSFIPVLPVPFAQYQPALMDSDWPWSAYHWTYDPYKGPAYQRDTTARVVFAPNTTEVLKAMEVVAKAVACPQDISKCTSHQCFQSWFVDDWNTSCQVYSECVATPACWRPLIGRELVVMANEEAAVQLAVDEAKLGMPAIDAIVAFQDADLRHYKIRMNHSDVPSSRKLFQKFDISPNSQGSPLRDFADYWFFTNLQLSVDRALLGLLQDGGSAPAQVSISVEPFPWPAKKLDIAAALAATAFNLLIVFAFMVPSRGVVATIVREKELRLREGMRILGLKETAYWASWALTNWVSLALTGLVCTIVGMYPFAHSSFLLMLGFFWAFSAALVSYSYFLSTLFSQSRVAGSASQFIYALSMLPGFIVPAVYDYGGAGWYWACLLPPSAASMFAGALVKWEGSAQGLSWSTVAQPLTDQSAFAASSIYGMLMLDVLLFALLTWYFDKVMPGVGQQQPPWFPLLPSYWIDRRSKKATKRAQRSATSSVNGSRGEPLQPLLPGATSLDVEAADGYVVDEEDAPGVVAVQVEKLRKVFRATDGSAKVAVNDINLTFERGKISALLGHNGAGKTTTIHMLTGMLQPTSGQAYIGGLSIWHDMSAIRRSLGVCPQFDILWPDITVREHLNLYAAIKGVPQEETDAVVVAAAQEVDLAEKLDVPAGELSGGQRRKLSVAIAFMGQPEVVFLDEPTSGMDPYSRRFTWEVIRRRRHSTAIILTTHSMEEADVLCDHITIMADGQVAAEGTPLELKRRYGVGYTLTLVLVPPTILGSADGVPQGGPRHLHNLHADIDALITAHVKGAQLLSSAGAELAFRLPSEDSPAFPALLKELEARKEGLGVSSYGLGMTTLEEVFLSVAAAVTVEDTREEPHELPASPSEPLGPAGPAGGSMNNLVEPPYDAAGSRGNLQGPWLFLSQLRALFTKRALSARRDRLAVLTQLVVPLALVWLSLWVSNLSVGVTDYPPLQLSRGAAMAGHPAALMALPAVRENTSTFVAFQQTYGSAALRDSGATQTTRARQRPGNATLEYFLLQHWNDRRHYYDGLAVKQLPTPKEFAAGTGAANFTILVNETSLHALPAAASELTSALLRYMLLATSPAAADAGVSGLSETRFIAENHPLPTLRNEAFVQVKQEAGSLMLVLCLTMASAVLSASFVVFLVREADAGSKHVQLVSGAPPIAMWIANYLWDLANFCVPALGIIALFLWYNLPQFRGARLAAVILLLACFGLASLPLTYLLSFLFKDEMKALQRLNGLYFLVGYLGFLATFLMDLIVAVLNPKRIGPIDRTVTALLRHFSPHFCFGRGVFDVSQTYSSLLPIPGGKQVKDPFDRTVFWTAASHLMVQALVYGCLVLLVEYGVLAMLWHRFTKSGTNPFWRRDGPAGGAQATPAAVEGTPLLGEAEEDADVRAERLAIQAGFIPPNSQVLLQGVVKSYPQGALAPPLVAVKGLWTAIPPAECFGLLGVNGAGKTTTFRMLTGEVSPDAGDAYICQHSVLMQLAAARQCMGYCPQFDGLPGAMTGREVLAMFARLRGVPERRIRPMVSHLLSRLGLARYANMECSTYSGGNRRKLSVAVALVGHPAVVLLDEPSTGMDPAARHGLWSVLQHEVAVAGRSVVLTSHSMEECEALCGRIAIMVAGSFRCLGTVQHLKSRFGGGYSVELKLQPGGAVSTAVKQFFSSCWPEARLAEEQPDRLLYTIGRQGLDLPRLFEAVEGGKASLGIVDYAITQTTLEQVFIALANGGARAQPQEQAQEQQRQQPMPQAAELGHDGAVASSPEVIVHGATGARGD